MDGTWATFYGGPGDLSTTIEAYVALRLAGDPTGAPHMASASAFIRQQGGIEASRVFTRIWLALFGLWSWDELPVLPPELVLLPPWVPLNVYDFGCWARQTVVALTVVGAHRPVRHLPVTVDELRVRHPATHSPGRSAPGPAGSSGSTSCCTATSAGRSGPCAAWPCAGPSSGSSAARRPTGPGAASSRPWVYSMMALSLQGYALDHPVMQAGLKGLDDFTIEDERGRRLEACQSPVWDTALATIALADAGDPAGDPLARGVGPLAGRRGDHRGR